MSVFGVEPVYGTVMDVTINGFAEVRPDCSCKGSGSKIGNRCRLHDRMRIKINLSQSRYPEAVQGELMFSVRPHQGQGPMPYPEYTDRVVMDVILGDDGYYARTWVYEWMLDEAIRSIEGTRDQQTEQLAMLLDSCERIETQDTAAGSISVEWRKDDKLVASGYFTALNQVARMLLYKDNHAYGHLEGAVALGHRDRGQLIEFRYLEEMYPVS